MSEATKNAILSVIRVLFAVAGGIMVGKGWLSGDQAAQLATAVAILVPALWGIVDKYMAEKKTQIRVVEALNEPRDEWTDEKRQMIKVVEDGK